MADMQRVKALDAKALEIRKYLLRLCEQTLIHIGGDLSVADLMTVLWQDVINYKAEDPAWEHRDRFVLSKGHASAVTSFNQAMRGCFDYEDIYREYAQDNGRFAMHSCNLLNPYVDVSTGSLGHGLPVATGMAQGLRLKGNATSRVYVVMGDGELDEGTIWEAAAAAHKYGLGNLVGFVDWNHMQFDGRTKDVMDIGSITDKFRLYGWNAIELKDGNDIAEILDAIGSLPNPASNIPNVIVANTVKGKGVSFMEDDFTWHAGQITHEAYEQAVAELEAAFQKKWGEQ